MRVQIAFFCLFAIISTTLAESQEVDTERNKKGTIYFFFLKRVYFYFFTIQNSYFVTSKSIFKAFDWVLKNLPFQNTNLTNTIKNNFNPLGKLRDLLRCCDLLYTANVYRQTTDKLIFKSVISTQKIHVFLKTSVCCFRGPLAKLFIIL